MSGKIRYKLVLLGDNRVGKTTIRRCYMGDSFQEDYISTIGAGFAIKRIEIDFDRVLELQVWDLAGQPDMDILLQNYITGSHAAFVVFDLTARDSFEHLYLWFEKLFLNIGDIKIPVIILGNKTDLIHFVVTEPEVNDYLVNIKRDFKDNLSYLGYIFTSAKTGNNIELAFDEIIKHLETPWND